MTRELLPPTIRPSLFGRDQLIIPQNEHLATDITAAEVLCYILNHNPDIVGINYKQYNPCFTLDELSVEDVANQPIMYSDLHNLWPFTLRILSTQIEQSSPRLERNEFGGEYQAHDVLAICSQVQSANGSTLHIPQLGFWSKSAAKGDLAELGRILRINGFLLEADVGYHFWGINLLSPQEWHDQLKHLIKQEKDIAENTGLTIDTNFLEIGLQLGYTALRLFGYVLDEDAHTDPTLVRVF